MYRVLIGFCDGENGKAWAASQGGVRYEPGDIYPRAGFTPSESHIAYLMGDNNKFRAPLIVVDDDTATTEGGADVLQCPHCDKQYKTAEGLAKHIAEKHPAAPAQVTDDAAATEGGAEAQGGAMATYDFYAMVYHGGKLTAELFDIWVSRAEDIVSLFERDYTVTATQEQRDKAVCAIAEAAYMNDKAASVAFQGLSGNGGIVSSKSIGSVSVSYRQPTAAEAGVVTSEAKRRLQYYEILRRYATVYRGVR